MDAPEPQRLAEMEERLRGLQERLEADLGVRAQEDGPRADAPAPPAPPRRVVSPQQAPVMSGAAGAMAGHLLRAMRELLDGYEVALAQGDPRGARLDMSAGPFADTRALEAFARAVRELPGVIAAEVRGYEGTDRAIVEIDLGDAR
jgi:hypothetical protein